MLKTITPVENSEISLYAMAKAGRNFFKISLVIGMAYIGIIALVVILYKILRIFFSNYTNLLQHIFPGLTIFLLLIFPIYIAYIQRHDSIDNGKNAKKRFWRRFDEGKIPKLVDLCIYNEIDEKKVHSGDILSGIHTYKMFQFYENFWRIPVFVLIPEELFDKIKKIIEKRNYRVKQKDHKIEIIFNGEEKIVCIGEEIETYRFIERLLKTQGDRINRIYDLQHQLEKGVITPMEYVQRMEK